MKTFKLSAHYELACNDCDAHQASTLTNILQIDLDNILARPMRDLHEVREIHATAIDLARQAKLTFTAPISIIPNYY